MNLKPVTKNDVVNNKFFKLYKFLFYEDYFKDISIEAKVVYSIFSDRLSLSLENNFVDKNNQVFIIFPNDEIGEMLSKGKDKIIKVKKELIQKGLITEKRQGLNKPNKIYIFNLDVEKAHEKRISEKQNSRSRQNRKQKVDNIETIKTDSNKTDSSKTKTTTEEKAVAVDEIFLKNYKAEFKKQYKGTLDNTELKKMYILKGESILNKYLKDYQIFLDSTTYKIRDICRLFNFIVTNEKELPVSYTPNIKQNKPIQSTNYEQREYDDDFFNSLYDNVEFIKEK